MASKVTPKVMPSNKAKLITRTSTKPVGLQGVDVQSDAVACRVCGRNFNKDRIAKHEQICEKTSTKNRKVFDVVKQRVEGTPAELFTNATFRRGKKTEWRKKHEEFIASIKAARELQQHLAKGGKLTDLPPPPPAENADYVQCPHCKRKFNETAAARHIPKCSSMSHNKGKPMVGKPKVEAKPMGRMKR